MKILLTDKDAEIKRLRAELSDMSLRLHATEMAAFILRLALKNACHTISGRRLGVRHFIKQAMKEIAKAE